MDDAFGALAYDDEECGGDNLFTSSSYNAREGPNEGDAEADGNNGALFTNEGTTRESASSLRHGGVLSFAEHSPLDWHMRLGDELLLKRRRQEESRMSMDSLASRILLAKRRRRLGDLPVNNTANGGGDGLVGADSTIEQHGGDELARGENRSKRKAGMGSGAAGNSLLLNMPPMTGVAWWGINSADNQRRAYVQARARHIATVLGDNQRTNSSLHTGANAGGVDQKFVALLDELRYNSAASARPGQALPELAPKIPKATAADKQEDGKVQQPQKMPDGREGTSAVDSPFASSLWADKYRAEKFIDLLTDNEVNRLSLLWLRSWDPYVFKRRFNQKGLSVNEKKFLDVVDEKGPLAHLHNKENVPSIPKHKVLLIYGPSGCGKSSLAYVVARQAGYLPRIINVNEFSSSSELIARIDDLCATATNIQSMFSAAPSSQAPKNNNSVTANQKATAPTSSKPNDSTILRGSTGVVINPKRPNCIILEGVEFASGEMVRMLANWARRPLLGASPTTSGGKHHPRGAGTPGRPLILTTDNAYTLPLKALRECSLMLKVPPCQPAALLKRLQEICAAEGVASASKNSANPASAALPTSQSKLAELIEASRADIRLCLNTLQFTCAGSSGVGGGKGRSTQGVTTAGGSGSLKDDHHSIFDVLSAVMTLDFRSEGRGTNGHGVGKPPERCQRVVQAISQRDDLDRFYQALHHNLYTTLRMSNSQLRRTSQLFVEVDQLHCFVYANQQFQLLRYLPYVGARLHLLVAAHLAKRKTGYDMRFATTGERLKESGELVKSVRIGVAKCSRLFLPASDLVLSTLPAFYLVAQPPIQALNSQMFSSKDANAINRCMGVMQAHGIGYSLKYEAEQGGTAYEFNPPIERIVCYPAITSVADPRAPRPSSVSRPHLLSNNTKKHIAQRLEQESARRGWQASQEGEDSDGGGADEMMCDTSMLETTPAKGSRNSGGHEIFSTTPLAMKRRQGGGDLDSCVLFKYNQGSSKAIKRNVKIGEIFPESGLCSLSPPKDVADTTTDTELAE